VRTCPHPYSYRDAACARRAFVFLVRLLFPRFRPSFFFLCPLSSRKSPPAFVTLVGPDLTLPITLLLLRTASTVRDADRVNLLILSPPFLFFSSLVSIFALARFDPVPYLFVSGDSIPFLLVRLFFSLCAPIFTATFWVGSLDASDVSDLVLCRALSSLAPFSLPILSVDFSPLFFHVLPCFDRESLLFRGARRPAFSALSLISDFPPSPRPLFPSIFSYTPRMFPCSLFSDDFFLRLSARNGWSELPSCEFLAGSGCLF